MSIRRLLGGATPSLLLPRSMARMAQTSRPKCAVCMRSVDAYGLENDTPKSLEIWARCDGVPPEGGPRVHAVMRAGFRIDKSAYSEGLSDNEVTDIMSRMTLRPGAMGQWVLDRRTGGDNVRPA